MLPFWKIFDFGWFWIKILCYLLWKMFDFGWFWTKILCYPLWKMFDFGWFWTKIICYPERNVQSFIWFTTEVIPQKLGTACLLVYISEASFSKWCSICPAFHADYNPRSNIYTCERRWNQSKRLGAISISNCSVMW